MKRLIISAAIALSLAIPLASANENTRSAFDRNDYSWGFRGPAQTQAQQRQLLIWCQKHPSKCMDTDFYQGGEGGAGGDGGSGTSLGTATAIGNQNVIVIEGEGNTVNFEANQTNDGSTVKVDQNISDNELDINIDNDNTNINEVNGDVIETTTTNTTTNRTKTTTTTTTNNKTIDIEVHDIDISKPCCVK